MKKVYISKPRNSKLQQKEKVKLNGKNKTEKQKSYFIFNESKYSFSALFSNPLSL